MDILSIIRKDHKSVTKIMEDLLETTPRALKQREQQLGVLGQALRAHMHAEETVLYPFVLEEGDDREIVFESIMEHKAARTVLNDLDEIPVDDERWRPTLKVLSELIQHHIEEEEGELFDAIDGKMGDGRADAMGEQFLALEKESRDGGLH